MDYRTLRNRIRADRADYARQYNVPFERAVALREQRAITDCLRDRSLNPRDFSIKSLFEACVDASRGEGAGRDLVDLYNPRNYESADKHQLREATDAVTMSDFGNITGQIVFSMVMEPFGDPNLLHPQLFQTIHTEFPNGEKIPGIGGIGDRAEVVGEAQHYPLAGVSEEFIETPALIKRGMIVPVTREAIAFDRTGVLLNRARDVGRFMAINKEKRCLDVALGVSTVYRRNGVSRATYLDTGGFDNLAASNALVDWTDVETAELLFDAINDPNTGEPIDVVPDTLIVPTALRHTARRIVSATEVRHDNNAAAGTQIIQTLSASPLGPYNVLSSPYVSRRVGSSTTWFIGQPMEAFIYMENWAPQMVEAPSDSHDSFHRDIVTQFKISERGAAAVKEPRRMVKSTA